MITSKSSPVPSKIDTKDDARSTDQASISSKSVEPYFVVPDGTLPNAFFVGMEKEYKELDRRLFDRKRKEAVLHERRYDARAERRKTHVTEGDVFEFVVPDGRLGYGIIVKRGGLPNGGTPYTAIFRSLFEARPDLNQLVRNEVALAGWTMDGASPGRTS